MPCALNVRSYFCSFQFALVRSNFYMNFYMECWVLWWWCQSEPLMYPNAFAKRHSHMCVCRKNASLPCFRYQCSSQRGFNILCTHLHPTYILTGFDLVTKKLQSPLGRQWRYNYKCRPPRRHIFALFVWFMYSEK
jgi:hypothetical protein